MEKPKLLFIESLWCDQDQETGITNAEHYLWNTYKAYGGEFEKFHFDQWFAEQGTPGDAELLKVVSDYQPDVVFLDWHLGSPQNPTPETLREIHTVRKIPVIAIWWDHVWNAHIKCADMLQYWVDLNVVVDSAAFFPVVQEKKKYIFLWTPQDKKLYHNGEKIHDVGFYGRIERKPGRREIIEKLLKDIPDFQFGGGRREGRQVSKEEYARLYRDTAMVVNFSGSNSGYPQLVGRTMEATLSGCLLLEEKGKETAGLFRPGIDYVEWKGYDDLVDKIRYYRAHREERQKIAQSGCDRATKYYNSDAWWDTVLRAL